MLHILWMLMKFILILLGILLGLLLCLALLILFCPLQYRAKAVKEKVPLLQTEADIRVSWLFGGISLRYIRRMGEGKKQIRVLGIPIEKLLSKKKKQPREAGQTQETKTFMQETNESEIPGAIDKEVTENKEYTGNKNTIKTVHSEPEQEENLNPIETENPETSSFQKRNKFAAILEKLNEIRKKISDIPGILRRISLTIHGIYDKIDWWKSFLDHPRVRAGFHFAKLRGKKLLFHVFPKKVHGQITFDSEDPSVTGAVLAVLGMTMPLHKNRIQVTPLFENRNILEGNIELKGRIYGFVPVKILLELYFNKDIKYIIRRWKHKEV